MPDIKFIITPAAIVASRKVCRCESTTDRVYKYKRDNPVFRSCLEYWGSDFSEWCDGCVNSVHVVIDARIPST